MLRIRPQIAFCVIGMAVAACSVSPAMAQPQESVRHSQAPKSPPSLWKQHWPEYSTTEGIFTVAAGVGTLALFLYGPVEKPRWQGGILFDDAVRNGLRAESKESR